MSARRLNSGWQFRPDPVIRSAVKKVAAMEDRSIANSLRQLVREALLARGIIDAGHEVEAVRGQDV